MKKCALMSMMALVVAALATLPVLAAEEAPASVAVTVTGTNYGVLGALGGGADAGAMAELNALKVSEAADAEGNAIADLAGKTLHYVPTKGADALQGGEANRGKTVKVTGKLIKDACALIVESFEVVEGGAASDDDDWDDLPTGTLSQQQIL